VSTANRHLYVVAKKELGHKGVQRKHHDASAVAVAVGKKAHLRMKQR